MPVLLWSLPRYTDMQCTPFEMQTSRPGRDTSEQASSVVLVAKALTKSDTGGRVILPRVSVESNLRFLIGFRRVVVHRPCLVSGSLRSYSHRNGASHTVSC